MNEAKLQREKKPQIQNYKYKNPNHNKQHSLNRKNNEYTLRNKKN